MEDIIVLGKGGHAGSLIDILERENKYRIVGYVVNDREADNDKYPVIGSDDDLEKIFQSGITNAAMGIGYIGKSNLREIIWKSLKKIGYHLPVVCDHSAVVSNTARIEEGSFIGKGAIINSNTVIGKMCIINTGAIIEHDCIVDDFSHISVGSVLCGNVKVGKASFVGANATIIQGRTIGNKCIVGAGEVLKTDLGDNSMIVNREIIKSYGGGV